MKKLILAAACLLLAGQAQAGRTDCDDGFRALRGGKVIRVGDSEARVFRAMPEPDRTVQLFDDYGAPVGQSLRWYTRGKTYTVWINGGRVVQTCEILD